MGISVDAFLAPLACGYLGQRVDWSYGFATASIGMVCGFTLYLFSRKRYLSGIGYPSPRMTGNDAKPAPPTASERQRICAVLVIVVLTIPFWVCYEQVGSSLSLFADRHLTRTLGNFVIPASWFQSINPVVILLFAPLLAWLWEYLQRKHRAPEAPPKMTVEYLVHVRCVGRGAQRDAFVGQPAAVCGDRSISVLGGVDAFSGRALLYSPACVGALRFSTDGVLVRGGRGGE
jgi:POT family proton-dependent oligopeptide transporter